MQYGNMNPQNNMQYGNMNPQIYNMQLQQQTNDNNKRNVSNLVVGIISAILLFIGVFAPAIDFSVYHESVQIQYSLMKICENVGLLSSMWMGIPYGILIAAVVMIILSFFDYPILKIIPSIIVIIMIVLMLVDVGNVVDWVMQMIEKFSDSGITGSGYIDAGKVISSFMPGIYCLTAGLLSGIAGCFLKSHKTY